MRLSSAILLAGLLLGTTVTVSAATIYKWVDAQGQTHFSSQPPTGQESEQLTSRSWSAPAVTDNQPAAEQSPDQQQKKIDADVKQQVRQEQARLKTYCQDMRTRLAQLNNNPRLMSEIDGKMVRLSEEQRQERIREANDKISEFCTGN